MSSIVGHATAGFTVFLCCHDAHGSSKRMAVIYVVLAICADLDYLAIWGLGYAAHPRVTHSILFALAAPVLARIALRSRDASTAPIAGLLIAGLSHPVLDLLVGAHGVPMLWPWRSEVSFPIGVLPSAGALDPTNYFFWRNLLIEMGILLPFFALLIAIGGRAGFGITWRRGVLIAPFWLAFVVWSVILPR